MVGFLGFTILAVGGGALALFLGVPPVFIGAYVIGLLLLGAIFGFGSSSSGGGGGGGSAGGGGGSSGSTAKKAMDAANGFMDGLGGSSSDEDRRRRRSSSDPDDRGSSKPKVLTFQARNISSGESASDVDIRVSVRDRSGSGLSELGIELPAFDSSTTSISGSSHSNSYNLASDILGSDPSPADGSYDVNLIVEDSEGNITRKSTSFKVGDSSSSSTTTSKSKSDSGGPDFSEMFKNMTIGQSQQQQMQQQMQVWTQMYQQQMQQQQMQQMMNPAVMQFGNFLQGSFSIQNNTVIIPGQNGKVEINIQQMQQLIQVLSQSQQDENYLLSIMGMLIQEGDRGLNQQIINQITNLVYEENKGDINIEQEINRFINQKRVEYVNNFLIQEVEQNFSLNQTQQKFALQISEFFVALENTQFDIEGNEVIISIQDASNLKIHYSTLLQFLKVVNKIPEGLVETIVVQILNQIVVKGDQDTIVEETVREIIMIIDGAEEGDIESSPTDIQVENIVIVNENTGNKLPEKMLDSGGLVYRAPAGISSGALKVNPRASTSGGDLQEVIFSLSSGSGSTQKRIGVNTSSFGYDGEGVTLGDIKGQFQLSSGQQFNLGVTFIAKDGNQRNKVCRIQVKGSQNSGKGQVPANKRGSSGVPANTQSHGKSDLPANRQKPGGSSSGEGEKALVPRDENEIQKDLQEAGEDISEAERLGQKALEDAKAGRLPEAEDEAKKAEGDLDEANDDIGESEEDISHIESVEGDHLGDTEEMLSNAVSNERSLASTSESMESELSTVKQRSANAYNDLITGNSSERLEKLENGALLSKGESVKEDAEQWKEALNRNWNNIATVTDRLKAEINSLEHLSQFLQVIDKDINEEENVEEILKQLAEYSSDQGLKEETERVIKQRLQLEEQEKQETQMYREIRQHLKNSLNKVEKLETISKQIRGDIESITNTSDNERQNRRTAAEQRSSNEIGNIIENNEEMISEAEQIIKSAESLQEQKIYSIENLKSDLQAFNH